MLPFPKFSYEAPGTLDELFTLASVSGSRIVAGGTDLLPSLKHRLFQDTLLISLRRLRELRGVTIEGGALVIGANTTLRDVARDDRVAAGWPALRDACRTIATSTIQAMGTLGGNVMLDTRCLYYNQPDGWRASIGGCLKADGSVCHVAPNGAGCYAAHSADTVPALWLYGAILRFGSERGIREVALADLYGTDGRTWLGNARDEVLLAIVVPKAPAGSVVHRKLRARGAIDYGMLLTAVHRRPDGSGAAVVSALGPRPVFVEAERVEDLAAAAHKAATPMRTHAYGVGWRKHMVRVEVERALAGS